MEVGAFGGPVRGLDRPPQEALRGLGSQVAVGVYPGDVSTVGRGVLAQH